MPVAVDATSQAESAGFAQSLSWSHTCSGSDRLLLVGVALRLNSATAVSSVTYGGQSLTFVAGISNGQARVELWRLINPPTGANTVTVTNNGDSVGANMAGMSVSFTGVDQTTPLGTAATNSGSSTGPTVDVSAATDDLVIDALAAQGNGDAGVPTATVGAGQTERANIATTGGNHGGQRARGAMSTEPGATTVTMSWTLSFSTNWGIVGVAVKPSAGAPPAAQPGWRTLLGVGR